MLLSVLFISPIGTLGSKSCPIGSYCATLTYPGATQYNCCCAWWGYGTYFDCEVRDLNTMCCVGDSTTSTTSTTTTTVPIISDICPYGTASTASGLICETDETAKPFDYYPIGSITPITCYECVQTSIGECEESDKGLDLENVGSQCWDADGLHPDASEKKCDIDNKCKTAVPIIKNVWIVSSVGAEAATDQNKIVEYNDDVYLYAIVQDTNCNTYLDYSSSSEIEASNYPDPQSISLDNRDVMPQLWNDEEWGGLNFKWYEIIPNMFDYINLFEGDTKSSKFWDPVEYSQQSLLPSTGEWAKEIFKIKGTNRYRAEVLKEKDTDNDGILDSEDSKIAPDFWVSSLGKPDSTTPHGLESDAFYKAEDGGWGRGIVKDVHRVSRKVDVSVPYCATAGCEILKTAGIYSGVPFIQGSASLYDQEPPEEHQAELLIGADCADMLIGTIRHAGISAHYEDATSTEQCSISESEGCLCYSSGDELSKILKPRGDEVYYKMSEGTDNVRGNEDDYMCEIDISTFGCIAPRNIKVGNGENDMHAEDFILFFGSDGKYRHGFIFKEDNGDGYFGPNDVIITTSSTQQVAYRDTATFSTLYIYAFKIKRVV